MTKIEETLKKLNRIKGQHTELISLLIPPGKEINLVKQTIQQEISQARNIKSKQTRNNVLKNLRSIEKQLPETTPQPFGVAYYAGTYEYENKQQTINRTVIPEQPIPAFKYYCGKKFFLEPLQLEAPGKTHLILVIDRKERTLFKIQNGAATALKNHSSTIPSKHHKGGQSAQRYARLIEEAATDWFRTAAEELVQVHQQTPDAEIWIAGPGPTKERAYEECLRYSQLTPHIQEQLLDCGYTDTHQSSKELLPQIQALETTQEQQAEQTLLQNLFTALKTENQTIIYGEEELTKAAEAQQLEIVYYTDPEDVWIKRHRSKVATQHLKYTCAETEILTQGFQGRIGKAYY